MAITAAYEKIIKYIDEHISEEITIDGLSRFAGYSKWNIYKLFGVHSDLPVMEYIRRKKISAAAGEMRSDKKLYDIALDYGYETPAGFYKAFFNIFGCSPSDYKNNLSRSVSMNRTIEEISNAILLDPDNAALYVDRASMYHQLNQIDKTLDDLAKAIETDPKNTEAYLHRAQTYQNDLKDYDKAIEDCGKVLAIDQNQTLAYCLLGVSYFELGDVEKSEQEFDNAVKFAADLALAYTMRAFMYCYYAKQPKKAIEDISKAIELEPPNQACFYCNRSQIYSQFKQYGKAMEDANKAIELDPNQAHVYNNRAILYMQQNQYEKALEDYTRAIELDPNQARLYSARANIYNGLMQTDKAEADYAKSSELNSFISNHWTIMITQ